MIRWPSTGNWLTAESNGLFTAGVLFPEFREASQWRRIALERLYKQLDEDVYPDGMQYELAAGYNNWVVSEFADIVDLADLNGLHGEVPSLFLAKMEKMFQYLLLASMPNGQIPGLNDWAMPTCASCWQRAIGCFPGGRTSSLWRAAARAAGCRRRRRTRSPTPVTT